LAPFGVIHRFEFAIRPPYDDPRGERVTRQAVDFLALPVERCRTRRVLKVRGELPDDSLPELLEALRDPVLEDAALGGLPAEQAAPAFGVRVGFKPGVTDNVGRTAKVFIVDQLGARLSEGDTPLAAFTETIYLLWGPKLTATDVERLGRELLANPLIERIDVLEAAELASLADDREVPLADVPGVPEPETIDLPDDDQALAALSRERTLALSLAELRAIKAYYARPEVGARRAELGLPKQPTDIELEALAQTWSEHCKHKIFNAQIDYTDEHGETRQICSLFKSTIVASTREIEQRVDWLVSVFDDNAGVVRLDDELNLVFKVETHNSPSALDPYGGAITGIVGVNRDPFGTGIGAELLTNVWGYCLGSPFYDQPLPEGLLHPRRIRDGVHQGVIDGGNQSGVPYSRGFELFDDRFLGKPLVFCGTVGLMPREVTGGPSERKEVQPGDLIVMVGGRIGKDGIHGATFSSEALFKESPAQAVQIGDPITQKMMTDMLLEARDRGLYRTLTDNGAGGLSSSIGEMAELCGGATLDLERAPLKYEGLAPWEILLSEAQERMSLAVPPEQLDELLALAAQREVEATAIGTFTDDGRFTLRHSGRVVGEIEMDFLHDGCPRMELKARWPGVAAASTGDRAANENTETLLNLMTERLNFCSKEKKARQYDHEVKGLSVIKPLCGVRGDVPADATALRVRPLDPRGVLLAEGIAPRLSDIDPGGMTRWVVDLAVRRIVAAGGRLGRIAGLDNFCWPDPVESPQTPDGQLKLAGLVRSCEALAEMTTALDLPLISGKDSMKNDSMRGGVKISIPPTLLFSAMSWIDDITQARDLVPQAGELLYVLGETRDELGASELSALLSERDGQGVEGWTGAAMPSADADSCKRVCTALTIAADQGLVRAAHAPHLGGLGMGLVSLCLAGDLGCEVDLTSLREASPAMPLTSLVFSESGGRLLVCVDSVSADAFEICCTSAGVPAQRIGRFADRALRITEAGATVANLEIDALRQRYQERLRGI
jgi:phosphoribosylformylglycinamidine synthase II